jgi:hypothetical protein
VEKGTFQTMFKIRNFAENPAIKENDFSSIFAKEPVTGLCSRTDAENP